MCKLMRMYAELHNISFALQCLTILLSYAKSCPTILLSGIILRICDIIAMCDNIVI